MFDPKTLPKAKLGFFSKAAVMPTKNSGKEVAKAKRKLVKSEYVRERVLEATLRKI